MPETTIIPELEKDIPNNVTITAIEEGENSLYNPNAPKFKSIDELFEELENQ